MTHSFIFAVEKDVVKTTAILEQFEHACSGDKNRNNGTHYEENAYCLKTTKENLENLKNQIDKVLKNL